MKKSIIYITGANGFIGQNLVNYLSPKNYEVHALIRPESLPKFNLTNVHIHYGDLLDQKSLDKSVPKESIIVNLAANPYHPKLSYEVNVNGTANLLKVAKSKNIKIFIQASSQATKIKVKGNYGKSKELADQLIVNSTVPYTIIKPSLVYGDGEEGLFNNLKKILSRINYIPVFGNGKIKINPINIDDLCIYIEKIIIDPNTTSQIFDIGSLDAISYNDFYKLLILKFNPNAKIIHLPIFIGLILSYLFKLLKNPPFTIDNVLGSIQKTNCKSQIISNRFNYKPLNFKEGLEKLTPKKTSVAVIGMGKMGMLHSTILNTFSDVNLTTLIEPNKKIHSTLRSMFGIKKIYTNLDDALKENNIDALFVSSPTYTHLNIVKNVKSKKIPLFIEKPICLNSEDMKYLQKQKKSIILYGGYTLLFNRTFNEVKKIIDSKKFGNLISFSSNCKHSEVLSPKKGWPYQKLKSGGGVLMNLGPHIYSLINFLFGIPITVQSKIKYIYSEDVEDEATVFLSYKNLEGNIYLNWSVRNQLIPEYSFLIKFEKAKIFVNTRWIKIYQNKKITIINQSSLKPLIPNTFNLNPDANGESYFIEDRLFIDSLKNGKKPINNLNFALKTENMIFQTYKNQV